MDSWDYSVINIVTFTVKEAGRDFPPHPTYLIKASTTVCGHEENMIIPKIAQDDQADYEGELVGFALQFLLLLLVGERFDECLANEGLAWTQCLVIGRDAKDVSEDDALDYIAAYTVGNDISSRKLQRDPALAGKLPQWNFSKVFDTYAPLGPCLVNANLIERVGDLRLTTVIDRQPRQDERVSDL